MLIALIIVLVIVLPKKESEPHTEHIYVYTDLTDNDVQHKKTCSGCAEVDELENHVWDNEQDTTCNLCLHTRTIEVPVPENVASTVKLSVDKTELSAGDTFTLTVEISTKRTDLTWFAISLDIGPLVDNASSSSEFAYSPDLAKNFEYIEHTTNLKYVKARWYDNTCDLFNKPTAPNAAYFRISLAYVGGRNVAVDSSETIIVTATLKVKDTATFTGPINFGVRDSAANSVSFISSAYEKVFDYANGTSTVDKGIESNDLESLYINKLYLNIKAKDD